MIESDKRIKFIAEYISAYEEKIKLLNSNGLFDAAKLFELFAIEVGSLYFGQKLSNLNVETFTYPCVDLVSEDKKTYIQVSTVKNIHSKIKSTLESIRDSERPEIKAITNVKFFLLNNDSVNKVKNHIGKAQIGNVPFNKVFDLITTSHILKKAETDLDFQIALYQLMKKETDSIRDNSSKLKDAIENSKSIGLGNIDCRLNDEYEIDRAELIAKIIKDNPKNTSIQGGAGSGKSVLCKKLVEGESCFVYARAERFLEETDINNIWGFNVRETLEYLKDKPIMFFVDSLEFIADSPTKLDLLSILYECTKNYPSARIITSCRTSDKKAFIKIEGNYSIHSYEVSELTVSEQLAIATKYPIIKKMLDINSYAELLKSPLYINLIVTKITNIDNIYDENQLREYIWHNVICLNDKNIREVIESIVFTRAREFLVGVLSANYDTKTISKLISENIIVRNGNTVRLKYDVFEDICFEQYLDNEFDKSKGKYDSFFKRIEAFGRCIYRRYQIWISNKLLAKCNRDKFLYELIFSKKMPLFWRNQTEIGLVKSRFCTEFFGENGQAIIKNGLLGEFVKMTNLYAFEMQNDAFIGIFPLLQLRPSGLGRQGLIHLIFENKIHEGDSISIFDFKKLCADYARTQPKDKKTAEEACAILIHIIERYISESEKKDFYNLKETINSLLKSLYQMTEYAKDWIITFWDRIASFYKKGTHSQRILADDIIKDALKFEHIQLATYMPIELCGLAEMYWTYSPKDKHGDDDFGFYQRDKNERSYQYGLSEKAEHYSFGSTRNTATDSNFFHILFQKNFWDGLNWAIEFVNKAVLNLSAKIAKGLPTYEINFLEDNLKREYLGFHEMWLVTTQEHSMPLVLSDLIYCLKEKLRYVIKNDAVKNKETVKFANNVKKTIYEKSNNTALLTIIADIGMEFIQKLPGFALDLATNIYIILDDLSRLALIVKNPVKEMLEKQIWMTVCMPFPMLHRYKKEDIEEYDLRSYVVDSQLYFGDKLRIKCQNILDYLYSIIPNDKENATEYLQIQNMDLLRTAQAVKVDEKTIALIPTITGEAKKVANKGKKQIQPENDLALLLKECTEKMAENKFELVDCLKTIDLIMDAAKKTVIQTMHENLIIAFIAIALRNGKLDVPTREKFCRFWIEGIRKYFSNGSFNYEYNISCVLFAQIETDIGDETKRQIKNLMLDLVQHQGQNGILLDIARLTRQYLSTNESFAQAIFNTIVKLAEDEMNHQKFNADYLKKHKRKGDKEEYEFVSNAQPRFRGVDRYIEKDKKEKYQSKREAIIEQYLYKEENLDLSDLDMNDYDITTMCYALNCRLLLSDNSFAKFVKKFVLAMIDVWKNTERTRHAYKILGVFPLHEVMNFLQRELVASDAQATTVLDILFNNINFSKFTRETIEFYQDIFGILLPEYFYAHGDKVCRTKCENILYSLEKKISMIGGEWVRIELSKSLILSLTRYGSSGDWSKSDAIYSYQDKQFLNGIFSKYGHLHLKEMLDVIYKLHMDKLLPEILLSVRDAFLNAPRKNENRKGELFVDAIKEDKTIVMMLITRAFWDFSADIKRDADLAKAFEDILEMLVEINYEEAATILDEFRVH